MNVAGMLRREDGRGSLCVVRASGKQEARSNPELFRRMAALSRFLSAKSIGRGDVVLVLTGSIPETVEILLATFDAGAAAAPISPMIGARDVIAAIDALQPACTFFDDTLDADLRGIVQDRSRSSVNVRREAVAGGAFRYGDIMAGARDPAVLNDHPPETPALIIRSSGSEGRPKVIRMSHGNLATYLEHHDIVYGQFTDEKEWATPAVSVFPFNHLAGITTSFQGLRLGRPTYVLEHFNPRLLLRLVESAGVRFLVLVASMYSRLLKEEELIRSLDLSSLEFCVAVGEPCPPSLVTRFRSAFGVQLLVGYGLTECLPGIIHSRSDIKSGSIPALSCGKLVFGEAKLIDERGRENPREGVLWIRNDTVYRCYEDDALNEAMLEDGWYRTKDVFARDADGHYYHRGRADDMFVCNGKNVYPAEVEAVLLRHPQIAAACAVPIVLGERVAPGVVVKARGEITETDIVDYMVANAPSHVLPARLRIVDELPSLGIGKIDRKACAALLLGDDARPSP